MPLTGGQHAKVRWLASNACLQLGLDPVKVEEERSLAKEFLGYVYITNKILCPRDADIAEMQKAPEDRIIQEKKEPVRSRMIDEEKILAINREQATWNRQQWEDHNREVASKAEERRRNFWTLE